MISIDFIKKLQKSKVRIEFLLSRLIQKIQIFLWNSKYIYYKPSGNLFTNKTHRIHGSPKVIISDRDPKFIGNSWKEL